MVNHPIFLQSFQKNTLFVKNLQKGTDLKHLRNPYNSKDFQRFLTFRKLFKTNRVVYLLVEFPIFNKFGNWHHSYFYEITHLFVGSNSVQICVIGSKCWKELFWWNSPEFIVGSCSCHLLMKRKHQDQHGGLLSTSVLWALSRHALLERGHVCTDLP